MERYPFSLLQKDMSCISSSLSLYLTLRSGHSTLFRHGLKIETGLQEQGYRMKITLLPLGPYGLPVHLALATAFPHPS